MKRLILSFFLFFLTLNAFAGGRIVTDSLRSNVLCATVKFNVYLPDSYTSGQHYPLVLLLHGLSDTYEAWDRKGNMAFVADELMETGECRPAVIVMPNAGGPHTATTWNGYFNMPGWQYEDFFFSEFLPEVERRYNAGGSKGQRAIMGLSMGGGGSTVYCQRHPDMFSSCYAMSPWLDERGRIINAHNGEPDRLMLVCKSVIEHCPMNFLKAADKPTLDALRTVKWFFDCGDDDFLFDQSVEMHQLMRDAGIKSELRVRNGIHNWEYWHQALRMALPFASRNFTPVQ